MKRRVINPEFGSEAFFKQQAMSLYSYDATVDGTAAAFVATSCVDVAMHNAFSKYPRLLDHVMAMIVMRREHYAIYARKLKEHFHEVDLKSPKLLQYLAYRILIGNEGDGLQRLRAFLGDINRWSHATTREAIWHGMSSALDFFLEDNSTCNFKEFHLNEMHKLCGFWDLLDNTQWGKLCRIVFKKGMMNMWTALQRKASEHGKGDLYDLLNDETRRECCLLLAKSTNVKLFQETLLKFGSKWMDWFESPQREPGFLDEVFITAACHGRMKLCELLLEQEFDWGSVSESAHKKVVCLAAYMGHRKIVSFYCGKSSPLPQDEIKEILEQLAWICHLYSRKAILFDLSKLDMTRVKTPGLPALKQILSQRDDFNHFVDADFKIAQLLHNPTFAEQACDIAYVIGSLLSLKMYDEALAVLRTFPDAVQQDDFLEIVEGSLDGNMFTKPKGGEFVDYLLRLMDKNMLIEQRLVQAILIQSIFSGNDYLFHRYVSRVDEETISLFGKHHLFSEGSIYRQALFAQQ